VKRVSDCRFISEGTEGEVAAVWTADFGETAFPAMRFFWVTFPVLGC